MTCPLCGSSHEAFRSCIGQPGGSRVGQVVGGKYRVLRRIAEGGTATVYEARHVEIERPFALKFMHPRLAADRAWLGRFRREASAAGGLVSEHIAAVLDFGVDHDGAPFIVMELLQGEDLDQRLERLGSLKAEEAVNIVFQACQGLLLAHAADVVHRDLKPANIFLCQRKDGSQLVKLLDFGIAKVVSQAEFGRTRTGSVVGTAWYMSPEQARGDDAVGASSDVYSLGVVLYELLSGVRPFEGDNYNAVLHQVLSATPPRLAALCPTLSEKLCMVVERAMARDPKERLASAEAFAKALRPFVVEESRGTARGARRGTQGNDSPALSQAGPTVEALETTASLFFEPSEDTSVDVLASALAGATPAEVSPAPSEDTSSAEIAQVPSPVLSDADLNLTIPEQRWSAGALGLLAVLVAAPLLTIIFALRPEEPAEMSESAALNAVQDKPAVSSSVALLTESAQAAPVRAPLAALTSAGVPAPTAVLASESRHASESAAALSSSVVASAAASPTLPRRTMGGVVAVAGAPINAGAVVRDDLLPTLPPVAASSVKPRSCSPTWYVDLDGIRRVKAECIRSEAQP